MRLSKNGSGHQQVRVYFNRTLIFMLLLKNSNPYAGHLLVVDSAIRLACERQLSAIMQKHAAERAIVNLGLGPLFSQVMGKISVHALRGAYQQLCLHQQHEEVSNICLGLFRSTMGYPCQHEMIRHSRRKPLVPLSIDSFDQHWWLVQSPPPNDDIVVPQSMETTLKRIAEVFDASEGYRKRLLLERALAVSIDGAIKDPVQAVTRGRPTGSTRRLPSAFEIAEGSANPAPRRRCGRCSQTGHNARTCHAVVSADIESIDNIEIAYV